MILKNLTKLMAFPGCPKATLQRQILHTFGKQKDNEYGIKFDEEQIKKKMADIKERIQEAKVKKTDQFDFMRASTSNQIWRKMKKFRQQTGTEHLFHFSDVTLEQKPTTLQITGFDENSIEVDSMVYPPCMIIFPNQCLVWQVLNVEQLTIDDFIIMKYVAPKPTYVIVGVNDVSKFPAKLKEQLSQQFQNFDLLQLFEATSQFNVVSNDDINVAAFLISK